MDWKSTAVISGAGILATWFFSLPAGHSPASGALTPAAHAAQTAASTIDIEREAARLQVRVHPEAGYAGSSRNPFRFGARPVQAAHAPGASAQVQPALVVPQAPPAPRITLDGIAADMVGDQPQRTAILKTDAGVVLAREGDQVGPFRVTRIAADAVELVTIDDGSVVRLALR